jgi:hypothetical protein
MIFDHGSVQLIEPFWAEVIIRHPEKMINDIFGVCLVSIIGEHQRDYRESVRL